MGSLERRNRVVTPPENRKKKEPEKEKQHKLK